MIDIKTAIVWGADSGIGKAVVKQLVTDDWKVAAVSFRAESLAEFTPYSFTADTTNEMAVKCAVQKANDQLGEISLWIYAVAAISTTTAQQMAQTHHQHLNKANLTGAYLTTHHSLSFLTPYAHLFYLVGNGLRLPKLSAYAQAKANQQSCTEAKARKAREKRITVIQLDVPAEKPLPMANGVASSEKTAERIISAYHAGHSGVLDLVSRESNDAHV